MVYDIPKNIEFISHGRLCKNLIIYIEDHKKVKSYDIETKINTLLFTMSS